MCLALSKLSIPQQLLSAPQPAKDQSFLPDIPFAELISLDKWNASPYFLESTSCFPSFDGFLSESPVNQPESDFLSQIDFTSAFFGLDNNSATFDAMNCSTSVSSPNSTFYHTNASREASPIHSPTLYSPNPEVRIAIPTVMIPNGSTPEISFSQLMPTQPPPNSETVLSAQNITTPTPVLHDANPCPSTTVIATAATPALAQKISGTSKRLNSRSNTSTMATKKSKTRKRASSDTEEELDEVTLKRMRNTEAARRSRLRKSQKMESLEAQIKALQSESAEYSIHVAVLENEKVGWLEKELELTDMIKKLEERVLETQKKMLNLGIPIDNI